MCIRDSLLHLLAGETETAAAEVTATPRDRLMTVAPGHVVAIMIAGDARCETMTEDVTTETEGSMTARMRPGDHHRGRSKELNRRVGNGMGNKDRLATIKAVLVTASFRQMCHRTSNPISRKPHSRLSTRLRSLHHLQCRISSLPRSRCSPSRLLLRCSSRDLVASPAECHHLLHPTSADRTLQPHQTLLQCRTTHIVSTISGATSSRERILDSISNRILVSINNRIQAASRIKAIRTKRKAKVDSRADSRADGVGMEGIIKVVGTTTEAVMGVDEEGDIDVTSQKRISLVRSSKLLDSRHDSIGCSYLECVRGVHLPLL